MTPRALRRIVVGVCAVGIGGMIASSVAASTGGVLTFGLVTATAVLCLMVATAVSGGGATGATPAEEARAARVEDMVARLVAAGADEAQVRALVREAVRLGRAGGR